MNPRIAEEGHKGQRARAAKERREREAVVADFPPLTSIDNALRRLELLNNAIARGLLAGSQGSAAVRCIEVWLRGESARVDRERLKVLEKEIERLERELAATRRSDR